MSVNLRKSIPSSNSGHQFAMGINQMQMTQAPYSSMGFQKNNSPVGNNNEQVYQEVKNSLFNKHSR